ncbi:MAG: branched-chain-amino-acid transaminase [Gammaproteobacteria bacterium]|nr:branched-chain-amino-acid transaminase [Gammaproteobacteria bacterium]
MALIWLNGKICEKDQAKISVFDHGLLYGDGVFEGIRFYGGKPFQLSAHVDRLFDSASYINLRIPYSKEQLAQTVLDLIRTYAKPEGYIRLVVTRGEGGLGINPALCAEPTVIIIADQLQFLPQAVFKNGAKLIIAATRRLAVDGLDPRVKSLNYLNHILARLEANHANADEAILLNAQGYVTEGSTDNIFLVKNNTLLTPPVSDGALNGITRRVVLELADRISITYSEQSLTPYDLYTADECFLTGTAAELVPVAQIDGRTLPVVKGPVFQKLQTAFQQLLAEIKTD